MWAVLCRRSYVGNGAGVWQRCNGTACRGTYAMAWQNLDNCNGTGTLVSGDSTGEIVHVCSMVPMQCYSNISALTFACCIYTVILIKASLVTNKSLFFMVFILQVLKTFLEDAPGCLQALLRRSHLK